MALEDGPKRLRASDADREQAAGLVRRAYADGQLADEELEHRTQRAYVAKRRGDLRDLLADLPDLLRRLDEDVLPTLRQLRTTPADVRALRSTVADIEPLVGDVEAELAGLPGSGLLRRRGRKADADEPVTAPAPPPSQ